MKHSLLALAGSLAFAVVALLVLVLIAPQQTADRSYTASEQPPITSEEEPGEELPEESDTGMGESSVTLADDVLLEERF